MPTFSANLGFLWQDRPLPAAIHAAAEAGFAAVECHWPYDTPAADITEALRETRLRMISLNTRRGDRPGDFGLAALPGRQAEARGAVDEAISYANAIGARNVHVMAGVASGAEAHSAFLGTLQYACDSATGGLGILIEPISVHVVPGYFLSSFDLARDILATLDRPNLRLMVDCYQAARMGLSVIETLKAHTSVTGHIQFAGLPDRGRPDRGTLDYRQVFAALDDTGWTAPLGAEYRPDGATEQSLDWLNRYA